MSSLTGILAVVARHAGETGALRLAVNRGGTKMKLSANPTGPLARLVGEDAARAIVAELGPETYIIPMATARGSGARRGAAARLFQAGANAQEVALACDMHERTARRVRDRLKKTGDQPDLFGVKPNDP